MENTGCKGKGEIRPGKLNQDDSGKKMSGGFSPLHLAP